MKFKLLVLLSLAAFLLLSGCRGGGNNTNAVINTNTNVTNTAVNRATPVTQTNESAATDPALKQKVEAALKAKGFTDVTVDTTGGTMTLRGSYPKDKLPELMQTAIEANGGKPVQNQATGK